MGKTKITNNKTGLLNSDTEDSGSEVQEEKFSINKKFAKEYEIRKQKQELRKVRLQDGSEPDEDDDEESSEDEDGELLTKKLDTDIFKTLNALKNKDKEIYNPDARFFKEGIDDDDDDEIESPKREKKDKRKRIKDMIREQILEEMDEIKKRDPEENNEGSKRAQLAYDDEQKEIRKAFLQSTERESDEEDEDDLMVLKKRAKGNEEDEDDGELLEEIEKLEEKLSHGVGKSDIVDPKGEVKDGENFLLNFFKKRSWIEQNDVESTESSDNDENEQVPMKSDGNESDESLEQLERNDDFEARYNFRFEAAEAAGSRSGADFSNIGYSRGQTIDTLRRKDHSRAQKRHARKERKEAERRAKEEQLKRLKNAKRAEMESKLKEIKKALGELEVEQTAVDEAAILKMMEGDYDPDKLNKLMEETFGDEFYSKEDAKWKSDQDVRKDLEQDEEGVVGDEGLYDDENADGDEQEEYRNDEDEEWVEEEEFNDEEYYAEGEGDKVESELEKKIKSKMAEELYKLDYEDIIAGMPTRFKYRQVEPNTYGLTTEEILFARDTSLRQYVSLKKMAPYREDGEYAVTRSKRRKFREMFERDLEEAKKVKSEPKETEKEDTPPDGGGEGTEKIKKKKRKRSKKGAATSEDDQEHTVEEGQGEKKAEKPTEKKLEEKEPETMTDASESAPKKKRRRKKADSKTGNNSSGISGESSKVLKDDNDSSNIPLESNKEKNATIPKGPAPGSEKKNMTSRTDGDLMVDGGRKMGPKTQSLTPTTTPKSANKVTTTKSANKESSEHSEHSSEKKKTKSPKSSSHKKKKAKKGMIEGITSSRLSSYGF